MNRQIHRADVDGSSPASPSTFTGHRGLETEEALIFEIGRPEVSGVDLEEPAPFAPRLAGLERTAPMGLPGLSYRATNSAAAMSPTLSACK